MTNKIMKKAMAMLIVFAMVGTVFSVQFMSPKNQANAATTTNQADGVRKNAKVDVVPVELSQCVATVSPALTINKWSTITVTGVNQNLTTGTYNGQVKLVPYKYDLEGQYYGYWYKYFTNALYTDKVLVEYPDKYTLKCKFDYYVWDSAKNIWQNKWTTLEKNFTYSINPLIVFSGNGGTISKKSSITNTYYMYSSLKTLPRPTRSGFSFLGWYTSKTAYNSDKLGTGYKLIVKDLFYRNTRTKTVYAHWSKSVTVRFSPNGGTVKTKSKKVTYVSRGSYSAKKTYGTLPTPKKKGKHFRGWYTKTKGGTRISKYTYVTRYSNHTLYAQWY